MSQRPPQPTNTLSQSLKQTGLRKFQNPTQQNTSSDSGGAGEESTGPMYRLSFEQALASCVVAQSVSLLSFDDQGFFAPSETTDDDRFSSQSSPYQSSPTPSCLVLGARDPWQQRFDQPFARLVNGELFDRVSFGLLLETGEEVIAEISSIGSSPVNKTSEGQADHESTIRQIVVTNITDRSAKELELRKLAQTHLGTGLLNGVAFQKALAREFARWKLSNLGFALIIVSLDSFEEFCASNGSIVSTRVLGEISQRISDVVREKNALFYIGEHQFGLIVPNVGSNDDAIAGAERIRRAISRPFEIGNRELFVTASVGAAIVSKEIGDSTQIISNAELAMADAKGRGGNDWSLHCERISSYHSKSVQVESYIDEAIRRDNIRTRFQAIVAAKTHSPVGIETLARVGTVGSERTKPAYWLNAAQTSGRITTIDLAVLNSACDLASRLKETNGHLKVAVNISQSTLKRVDFHTLVTQSAEENECDMNQLVLELPEAAFTKLGNAGLAILDELAFDGVTLAVDLDADPTIHFGHLAKFSVAQVKLPNSMAQMLETKVGLAKVEATVKLAQSYGLKVCAKGVDSERKATVLAGLGVDYLQGWAFYKLHSAAEIEMLLGEF